MEITTSVFFHHACGASPAAPASSTMKKKQSCFRPAATTRMDIGRAKAKRLSSTARSVMARPHEAVAVALPPLPPAPREAVVAPLPPSPPPARDQSPTETATTSTTTTVYQDNWFDKVAIGYLSRKLQEVSGLKNGRDGYEGLIEAALTIAAIFKVEKQWEIVSDALQQAIPSYILTMIKVMMPPSRFSRQYFAAFTTIFFPWLVGPCEVIESEVDGKKEKNVVYVPKCRFLESTNCVGMCTNLCKIPSEKFIKDAFGMPVYMSPNFEDMSCQMIFGQEPPEDDPTLKQPCFATKCIAKQKHRLNCSS